MPRCSGPQSCTIERFAAKNGLNDFPSVEPTKPTNMKKVFPLLLLLLPTLYGQQAANISQASVTAMGNAAEGTVYSIVVEGSPTSTSASGNTSQPWLGLAHCLVGNFLTTLSAPPEGMKYTGFSEQWPGKIGSFHAEGYVTVPVGETRRIYGYVYFFASDTNHNALSSQMVFLDTTKNGTAGSYTGPGSLAYGSGPQKQFTYDIPANGGVNTVTWVIRRVSDGVVMAKVDQSPGAAGTTLTAPGLPPAAVSSEYQLQFLLPGLKFDSAGGNWIATTSTPVTVGQTVTPAETVFTPTVVTPPTATTTGTTPIPASMGTIVAPKVGPTSSVTPTGAGGTVWRNTSGGASLSETVFMEGIDRITDSTKQQNEVAGAVLGAKGLGTDATSAMAAAGAAKKTEAQNAIPGAATITTTMGGSGTAPATLFTLAGNKTVDWDPFASGRFAGLASWFKSAIRWATLGWFYGWVWLQMGTWIRGFSFAPQAKGNPVVAGTGAQATALIAAGLITTAVIGGTTTLLAFAFGDLTYGNMLSLFGTNPFDGLASGALYFLNAFFPLATICTVFLARISFHMYAASVFAGVTTLIRFIVP